MIPILTLGFGHDQHLSQASAMIVNIFVSAPAVIRHQRARAIDWTLVKRMLPGGLVFIIIGVAVSNQFDSSRLMILFGIFLLYVAFMNSVKLWRKAPGSGEEKKSHQGWFVSTIVGSCMGFVAGLLGVGGGIIAVPLMQRVCRLPLRQCIAVSATAMCVTAPIGAIRKNLALPEVLEGMAAAEGTQAAVNPGADAVWMSLMIAACLAPTAIVGGLLGGGLTHSLPLKAVRGALVVVLAVAGAKYLGLLG